MEAHALFLSIVAGINMVDQQPYCKIPTYQYTIFLNIPEKFKYLTELTRLHVKPVLA